MKQVSLVGAPSGVERWPDGEVILVARPENPPLALALASVAVDHNSVDAFREASSGPLIFMGFLKKQPDGTPCIVDEKGKNPKPLEPGDILLSRHEISDHSPKAS